MAEPEQIFEFTQFVLAQSHGRLTAKKVLITAGPTYEAIDPVRFIGNYSTGKMGIAIAAKCAQENAQVVLILGPSKEAIPTLPNLEVIRVRSAEEMLKETQKYWADSHIGIFSAAVADYRPMTIADDKIKKNDDSLQIELIKNPDILGWAGQNRTDKQYLIGFALETENELEYAKSKVARKNLDLIVLNSLRNSGAGFGYDTNQVTLISKDNKITNFELLLKSEVAENLINHVIENIS
jgi:phosphopantothenoylcysteine decarboxylase/phosphopantothenate--cysteine ligase